MLKQSPSRNHRSKGFKVKHVIQICVLLAISIWLLFQIRNSYYKRKAYNESLEISSQQVQSEQEILRIGRKGLLPRMDETGSGNGKGEEDDGDEDTKNEENEDEGRGEEYEMGEDLIDENDDKDKEEEIEEEPEIEEKENQTEDEHDILESDSQEAREEHYKQDDASSAVVNDLQTISLDTEGMGLRKVKVEEQDGIINSPENATSDKVRLNEAAGRFAEDGGFGNVLHRNETRDVFSVNGSSSTITESNEQTMKRVEVNDSFTGKTILTGLVQAPNFTLQGVLANTEGAELDKNSSRLPGSDVTIETKEGFAVTITNGTQHLISATEIAGAVQNEPFGTFQS